MSKVSRALFEEHHAFYEVSPHYAVVDERGGSTQRIQDGFDVFIYAVKTPDDHSMTPPPDKYAQGYEALRKIVRQVADDTSHGCLVDVMPFPGTAVLNVRGDAKINAVLLVRIGCWGVRDTAGEAETRALGALEEALHAAGVKRR